MICSTCGFDGHPVQVLGLGGRGEGASYMPGMISVCAKCGQRIAEAEPAAAEVIQIKPTAPKASIVGPIDAIAICRARLEQLEAELEALESKRNEAATLRRMLDAADSVVREIVKNRAKG